jgi:hypothetical protein
MAPNAQIDLHNNDDDGINSIANSAPQANYNQGTTNQTSHLGPTHQTSHQGPTNQTSTHDQNVYINMHEHWRNRGSQEGGNGSTPTAQTRSRTSHEDATSSSPSHDEVTQHKMSLSQARHHLRNPLTIAVLAITLVAIVAILGSVIPTQLRSHDNSAASDPGVSRSSLRQALTVN